MKKPYFEELNKEGYSFIRNVMDEGLVLYEKEVGILKEEGQFLCSLPFENEIFNDALSEAINQVSCRNYN